jgi:hypothetical protein
LFLYSYARTVSIFDTTKAKVTKEITTFNNNISALCLRPDGAVFAAADEAG